MALRAVPSPEGLDHRLDMRVAVPVHVYGAFGFPKLERLDADFGEGDVWRGRASYNWRLASLLDRSVGHCCEIERQFHVTCFEILDLPGVFRGTDG